MRKYYKQGIESPFIYFIKIIQISKNIQWLIYNISMKNYELHHSNHSAGFSLKLITGYILETRCS